MLGDAQREGELGVGALLDDAQSQRLTVRVRKRGEAAGERVALRGDPGQLLHAVEVGVSHRTQVEAEPRDRAPLDGAAAEVLAELVARDPEDPCDRRVVALAAELPPVAQRLCERLRDEVDGDLRLERPPREEPQEMHGVLGVESRDIVAFESHGTTVGAQVARSVTPDVSRAA